MALALAAPTVVGAPSGRISYVDVHAREREAAGLDAVGGTTRPVKLAAAGAIGVSLALPLIQIVQIAFELVVSIGGRAEAIWAVVATALYLPLHIRHVVYAVRGLRPPGAMWTLAAMAVIILGALPLVGIGWLWGLSSLAVSALLLLRPPWSVMVFGALVAAPMLLAAAFHDTRAGPYFSLAVAWRSAPFVFIWLAGAIRELTAARQAAAGRAVEQERLWIDAELRRTLGGALEEIAGHGAAAGAAAGRSIPEAEAELRELVAGARRTLAETRRMVRGYQQASLRAELETAAALLAAGDIRARIEAEDPRLLDTVDEGLRAALRHEIAGLLQDGSTRGCVFSVSGGRGVVRLEIRADGAEPVVAEAVVEAAVR